MKATQQLHDLGPESLARQHHARAARSSGTLERYIDELSVTGLTSNPTIFEHAIKNSTAYDAAIRDQARRRASAARSSSSSSRSRTSRARPICSARSTSARTASTAGSRSRCRLCSRYDTASTIAAAKELHRARRAAEPVHQDPRHARGLPAIEEAIFAGVPINVTLLFSREHYLAAAEAFLRGIERRIDAGLEPDVGFGGFALRQPLGRGGRGQGARRAAQPARHRDRQAHLQGAIATLLGTRRAGSASTTLGAPPAAAAVGEHGNQGS